MGMDPASITTFRKTHTAQHTALYSPRTRVHTQVGSGRSTHEGNTKEKHVHKAQSDAVRLTMSAGLGRRIVPSVRSPI